VSRLKQSIEHSFLDEDRVLRNIERNVSKRHFSIPNKPVLTMIAASLILALLITTTSLMAPTNIVAGLLTVDINPSLRIELNKDYTVLNAIAQNPEAASMNLSILKGMKIQDALKEFVKQAIKDGYIDTLSLTEDYMLVTTISLNGKDETFNINLKDMLTQLQKEQSLMSDVQLALMEAKETDLEEAEKSNTPLWLYVLSNKNPDTLSASTSNVQGYFEDTALKTKFETEYGEVLQDTHIVNTNDIQEAMNELSKSGIDVSAYQTRLNQPSVDLKQLKAELLVLLEQSEKDEQTEVKKPEVSEEKEEVSEAIESSFATLLIKEGEKETESHEEEANETHSNDD
jgi:hypothetical protein